MWAVAGTVPSRARTPAGQWDATVWQTGTYHPMGGPVVTGAGQYEATGQYDAAGGYGSASQWEATGQYDTERAARDAGRHPAGHGGAQRLRRHRRRHRTDAVLGHQRLHDFRRVRVRTSGSRTAPRASTSRPARAPRAGANRLRDAGSRLRAARRLPAKPPTSSRVTKGPTTRTRGTSGPRTSSRPASRTTPPVRSSRKPSPPTRTLGRGTAPNTAPTPTPTWASPSTPTTTTPSSMPRRR